MSHYFFHVRTPAGMDLDRVGARLADPAAAIAHGHILSRCLAAGPADEREWRGWVIEVELAGESLACIPCSLHARPKAAKASAGRARRGPVRDEICPILVD